MQEVETKKIEEAAVTALTDMCTELFEEWLVDLNPEEKEIWFWNASVEMERIKQRRPLSRY